MQPTLDDVIRTEALALHSAEAQGAEALLRLSGRSEDRALGIVLQEARMRALAHATNLEALCTQRGWIPGSILSRTMETMCAETRVLLDGAHPAPAVDALIVVSVQRMGHLRIAGYGSAAALSKRLNDHDAAACFANLLREERETDERLSEIAESRVNGRAASADQAEGPRA